jgi:1-deoxy-D-xylulose-5-phosphate synthase
VFDLSFLRHIPNLTFAIPRDEVQLRRIMLTALQGDGPFAYRYPRGNGLGLDLSGPVTPLQVGRGEKLREGGDGLVLAVGPLVAPALAAAEELAGAGWNLAVIDPCFLKPLDRELLLAEASRSGRVITLEENVLQGGFGSAVLELLADAGILCPTLRLGLPDQFIEQGTQAELHARYGLDAAGITRSIRTFLETPAA